MLCTKETLSISMSLNILMFALCLGCIYADKKCALYCASSSSGSVYTGNVFLTIPGSTEHDCSTQCVRHSLCAGFNFYLETGVCELLDNVGSLSDQAGVTAFSTMLCHGEKIL